MMDGSRTARLVAAFLDHSLPKGEWTHHAHLCVGLWHVLRFGPAEALQRLREGIQRYNEASGGSNTATSGYHETITRFFIAAIADFLARADQDKTLDELAEELLDVLGDKEYPLRYYSRERLFSRAARQGWVEPDRPSPFECDFP